MVTPVFPSTKVSRFQYAFAGHKEANKENVDRYELPIHRIKHTEDLPHKPIEGFRTKSIESANKILAKRNISKIISAKFYDKAGVETVII